MAGQMKKKIERGDIKIADAIKQLEKEILKEVDDIAGGYKQSIYELVEKGKELRALKAMAEEGDTTKKAKAKGPAKEQSKGGIKAVAEADDFEDLEGDEDLEPSEDEF